MLGMITWTSPTGGWAHKRTFLKEQKVMRVSFLTAQVTRGPRTSELIMRRRIRAAVKRMRKAGVTRLVLPEDFPYGAELEKGGVMPVSTLSLRRGLAAELARAAMAGRGLSASGASIAVAGDQLSGEMARAVTELSLGSRYVLVDVPYGGEALAAQLRREYGVSLLLSPTQEQLEGADVLVLFAPRPDLRPEKGAVLRLYDETAPLPALLLPPALESQISSAYDRPQMLAARIEAGALRIGQITVGTAGAAGGGGFGNFL